MNIYTISMAVGIIFAIWYAQRSNKQSSSTSKHPRISSLRVRRLMRALILLVLICLFVNLLPMEMRYRNTIPQMSLFPPTAPIYFAIKGWTNGNEMKAIFSFFAIIPFFVFSFLTILRPDEKDLFYFAIGSFILYCFIGQFVALVW